MPSPLLRAALAAAFLVLAPAASAQPCTSGSDIVTPGPNTNRSFATAQSGGQSFTAPCDGALHSITINLSTFNATIEGTFRVYEGDGTGGAILVEQPFTIGADGPYTASFPALAVTSGQAYTFYFDIDSGSGSLFYDSSNGYAGGTYYFGTSPESATPFMPDDLQFTADFEPAAPGGDGVEIDVIGFTDDPQRDDFVFIRALATNSSASTIRTRVYFTVDYPDGTDRTYSVLSSDFPGNSSFQVQKIKRIKFPLPADAPAGTYTVTLFAADDIANGGTIYDSDTFTFDLDPIVTKAGDLASGVDAGPNPFTSETTIRYELAESAEVDLRVFDVTGREVASLASGTQSAGAHSALFAAGDLPGGVYVWRLAVGGEVTTGRMTLAR